MEEVSKYIALPTFPELHFNGERHIYTLDQSGITLELPSVTQILRFVSREHYGEVPQSILSKAADKGTRVHEAIELAATYGWLEGDDEIMPYLLAYQAWEKEHDYKTVASEYKLYHRTRLYSGTADRLFLDGDSLCLMDIKTTQAILGLLTSAQLFGYSEALKSHGVTVDKSYILHLKNDASYEWIQVDTKKGQMIFDACSYLHGMLKTA